MSKRKVPDRHQLYKRDMTDAEFGTLRAELLARGLATDTEHAERVIDKALNLKHRANGVKKAKGGFKVVSLSQSLNHARDTYNHLAGVPPARQSCDCPFGRPSHKMCAHKLATYLLTKTPVSKFPLRTESRAALHDVGEAKKGKMCMCSYKLATYMLTKTAVSKLPLRTESRAALHDVGEAKKGRCAPTSWPHTYLLTKTPVSKFPQKPESRAAAHYVEEPKKGSNSKVWKSKPSGGKDKRESDHRSRSRQGEKHPPDNSCRKPPADNSRRKPPADNSRRKPQPADSRRKSPAGDARDKLDAQKPNEHSPSNEKPEYKPRSSSPVEAQPLHGVPEVNVLNSGPESEKRKNDKDKPHSRSKERNDKRGSRSAEQKDRASSRSNEESLRRDARAVDRRSNHDRSHRRGHHSSNHDRRDGSGRRENGDHDRYESVSVERKHDDLYDEVDEASHPVRSREMVKYDHHRSRRDDDDFPYENDRTVGVHNDSRSYGRPRGRSRTRSPRHGSRGREVCSRSQCEDTRRSQRERQRRAAEEMRHLADENEVLALQLASARDDFAALEAKYANLLEENRAIKRYLAHAGATVRFLKNEYGAEAIDRLCSQRGGNAKPKQIEYKPAALEDERSRNHAPSSRDHGSGHGYGADSKKCGNERHVDSGVTGDEAIAYDTVPRVERIQKQSRAYIAASNNSGNERRADSGMLDNEASPYDSIPSTAERTQRSLRRDDGSFGRDERDALDPRYADLHGHGNDDSQLRAQYRQREITEGPRKVPRHRGRSGFEKHDSRLSDSTHRRRRENGGHVRRSAYEREHECLSPPERRELEPLSPMPSRAEGE